MSASLVGQRVDGNAAALGLSQLGGEPVAHLDGQHFGEVPSFRRPASCSLAGQFYNVFYMTGQEYDVVVVGSGAAGMVAALTAAHQGLSTLVVEKAPHYGGSTARSGGGVWIPNNEILKRDGVKDTAEAARTYLHTIIGDVVPSEKIDTYLDRGPEMLSFVLRELAAEAVLGARLLRLLPGGGGGQGQAVGPSSPSRSTPASSAPTCPASSRRTARFR